jgi:hypothetical protein
MKHAVLALTLFLAGPCIGQQASPSNSSQTVPATLDAMTARAIEFLRSKQDASGGWNVNPNGPTFPAITGLVLQGLLADPRVKPDDPAITSAVGFILSHQQKDGGVYDRMLPSYNTAICLSALARIPNPDARVQAAIDAAQKYLLTLQYGEGAVVYESGETAKVVTRDDAFYGGWGYGNHGRPDLSNTAFAVEALRASGLPDDHPAYQRALVFLQRCQMLESAGGKPVNDFAYARSSAQGGFIYATSENKERVGVGQSPAGEVVESLSGPPGCVAAVILKNGPDGKPLTLTRDAVASRLRTAIKASTLPEVSGIGEDFMVVLGPGSAGGAGSNFEVRARITAFRPFEAVLTDALGDSIDPSGIHIRSVAAWKGVSRLRAYGTMTYSGFKSYLYAGLARNDPRVTAALDWIVNNYTLEENPGMGTDGLYYYFVVFARAMSAYGAETVPPAATGSKGPRDWRRDLTERLARLQQPDGSFRVVDDRWMESDPVLITAYSLVALESAR